jgi:uncharacterized protein (DUF1800 family)
LPLDFSSKAAALLPALDSDAPTAGEASRFLIQATYGPTDETISGLQQMGYSAWIDDQLGKPPQKHLPVLLAQPRDEDGKIYNHRRIWVWWQQAVTAEDQLRQRMAYAWSQLFVVSDKNDLFNDATDALTDYYDTLLINGLGNFRDLLQAVTYHACMAMFLTYLGNRKADPSGTRRPDENYAREVMQLFTIGLKMLNPDGSTQLQAGQPIPTYTNDDVREMARVFTGMHFAGHENNFEWGPREMLKPLQVYAAHHDSDRKVLLGGRKIIEAGQAPEKDIADALDCLFEHPNTPPFVCRFLIERFTTSNPSPAYLGRVAQVFVDNGKGVRGDLSAVIRAILLDPETREASDNSEIGEASDDSDTGKQREPYLRLVALVRAFHGKSNDTDGVFSVSNLDDLLGQEPGCAPSVFNFYLPDYAPPGPIADAGMVGPEFQITTAVTAISLPNFLRDCVYHGAVGRWGANVALDFSRETQLASDGDALMKRLSFLLTADRMSPETRGIIRRAVEQIPEDNADDRVKLAVYLTSICAESAVQT